MRTFVVKYQIATYSGKVTVIVSDDADNDEIIAKAQEILRRRAGSFPYGYHQFWIEEVND